MHSHIHTTTYTYAQTPNLNFRLNTSYKTSGYGAEVMTNPPTQKKNNNTHRWNVKIVIRLGKVFIGDLWE